MVHANHYASSDMDAAAKTINGGTDLELGDTYWASKGNGGKGNLKAVVQAKTVTETRVDESVSRVLYLRFVTGQFDPIEVNGLAFVCQQYTYLLSTNSSNKSHGSRSQYKSP
jgi:beta-glucosidase-like glycosyl hydrolase